MPLITFNIYIIVFFGILHIIIKPYYKKRYPLKFAGSILLGILVALIYDLIPLACYVIQQIYKHIN